MAGTYKNNVRAGKSEGARVQNNAGSVGKGKAPVKESGWDTDTFVPPSMRLITGKSVMEEDLTRQQRQPNPTPQGMRAWQNEKMPEGSDPLGVMAEEGDDSPGLPLVPSSVTTPTTVASPYFAAGYLREHIGQNMRVQFLIGANGALTDRVGTLLDVGAGFIVLQPVDTDDLLMCDLHAIAFVTIFR